MVKFPGISGPLKSPEPQPLPNSSIPAPETYKLPDTMGKKTVGIHTKGPVKVAQALDRRKILETTSPEIDDSINQICVLALGEVVNKKFGNK